MRKFNMGTLAAKTVNAAEKAAEVARQKAAELSEVSKERGAAAKATVPTVKEAVKVFVDGQKVAAKSVWTSQVEAYKAAREGEVVVEENGSWVIYGELTA